MSDGGPRPRWLFRYGVWIRRALVTVALGILFIGKASGLPDNSPAAKSLFLVVLGLVGASLPLYALEYLLAVRYRGYWYDRHFD
jgi:hypothetical protein